MSMARTKETRRLAWHRIRLQGGFALYRTGP
jgi:hypothetical protein